MIFRKAKLALNILLPLFGQMEQGLHDFLILPIYINESSINSCVVGRVRQWCLAHYKGVYVMSKRRKRKARRVRRVVQQIHDNRHHLLFQRRYWEKNGYAKYLRNYFIFTIPVEIHNEYHHTIGKNIPIPEDVEQMAIDVRATQPEFTKVWMACWFLTGISADKAFKNAMIEQYNFFAERNI